jgi:ketosteroid isomerase-like protein
MSQADLEAVHRRHLDSIHAINAQWAPAGFFEPEGTLLSPGLPPIKGRQAIQAWFETMFEDNVVRLEPSDPEYIDCGDVVIESGLFTFTRTPKSGGPPVVDKSKWLAVWRRGPDGTWRLLKDMFNSIASG